MGRPTAIAAAATTALLLACLPATTAQAGAPAPEPPLGLRDRQPRIISKDTDTILVTFDRAQAHPAEAARDAIAGPAGDVADASIAKSTPITSKIVAVTLDQTVTPSESAAIGEQAEKADGVKAAEPSATLTPTSTNDTYYGYLWNLTSASTSSYGVNAESAWATSTGAGTIVGVIDTGITAHPDLTGSTTSIVGGNVIAGYDFISDPTDAGDGNGRDSDPTDAGDFCASDPNDQSSSWHGTHVAGTIAAIGNNATGVVGVAPDAKIEPLRALGRCGGTTEDILTAILWGAGVSVYGLPANPHPASVLNLSLGGQGTCSGALQSAIDSAVAKGVPVVVAAGNDNVALVNEMPANCSNVIRVVASTYEGTRAWYSNYGTSSAAATIAAPGGSGDSDTDSTDWIVSTWNDGDQLVGSPAYMGMVGTSMAAPHVAAIAALLKQVDPTMSPTAVRDYLVSTATPMSSCSTTACGAGVVNAARAVAAAAAPSALANLGTPTISGVAKVGGRLSTAGTGVAGASYSYQWRRNGNALPGQTGTSYDVVAGDLGSQLSVTVTATSGGQSASKTSDPTSIVVAGRFVNTVRPSTTGTYKKGKTLKVKVGSWSPTASRISYRWLRNGVSIGSATKSSYKLVSKDKGKKISVRVTVSRDGYLPASATSVSHRIR